jgi:hypothetical protein
MVLSKKSFSLIILISLVCGFLVGGFLYNKEKKEKDFVTYIATIYTYLPQTKTNNVFILSTNPLKEWSSLEEVSQNEIDNLKNQKIVNNPDPSGFLYSFTVNSPDMDKVQKLASLGVNTLNLSQGYNQVSLSANSSKDLELAVTEYKKIYVQAFEKYKVNFLDQNTPLQDSYFKYTTKEQAPNLKTTTLKFVSGFLFGFIGVLLLAYIYFILQSVKKS